MSEYPAHLDELPAVPESSEPQAQSGGGDSVPTPGTVQAIQESAPAAEDQPQAVTEQPNTGMDDVFSEEYTYQRPKRGQIRHGRVMSISPDRVIVDLGLKREGVVPADDLAQVGAEAIAKISVGDEIPVTIIRTEDDKEGAILVSWSRARQEQDWFDVEKLRDSGEIWEGQVRGHNRGGLIVHYGKIRGFVPASHITGISRRVDAATLQVKLAEMDNQLLPLKAIEVDRQNRRLIFSERVARREWRVQRREKLLDDLKEGDRLSGVVSNICDFGAFVDVGGTDGLVHISELSWRRTAHPSEVVQVGDEVDVYVLRVDRERKRIGLSMRLAAPDPWETADTRYQVGQLVTVTITKLIDFGAFATLEDGIEGLIHISELAEIAPKQPSDLVAAGTVVPAKIIRIDSARRRMGLSLRYVTDEELELWNKERAASAPAPQEQPTVEDTAPSADQGEAVVEPTAEATPPSPDQGEAVAEPTGSAEPEPEAPAQLEIAPSDQPATAVEPEAAVQAEHSPEGDSITAEQS